MFTTHKQSSSSSSSQPSCSSSPSSSSRRPPFNDITNQHLLPPSSPPLPSLDYGIPSSSPGFSLPRTPGGGGMSSPVRSGFARGNAFDEDEDEDEDEDDEQEERLVAGPSSGSGISRSKKARMSNVVVEEEEEDWGMEVDPESTAELSSRGRELAEEDGTDESTRGFRMPAGSNRYGAGRSMGAMEFLSSRGRGIHGGGRRKGLMGAQGLSSNLSTLDYYPSILVTSHSDDLYRMPSFIHGDFAPVFVCQFSNAAKNGGRQIMALGSEEGGLEFVDAGKNAQWDREHTRKSHRPHENAIFDLKWSPDDAQIVTSSGAQCSLVIDVETQTTTATLRGHTSSVKTTIWDPSNPNILASAARDGHINVYDLREGWKSCEAEQPKKRARGPGSSSRATGGEKLPVNTVRHAHGEPGQKKAPAASARTATRSPTSILYIPQRAHTIASCGTGDGVIKLWDLRTHGSYTSRKGYPAPAAEESHDPTFSSSSSLANSFGSSSTLMKRGRPHGIANMCLSKEGDLIYALGTDNKVHLHTPLSLSTPSISPSKYYTHPSLRVTFYSRLAISPCGRYLTSGSARGKVHLWEVRGSWTKGCDEKEREGIVLKADDGGREIGCVDWGGEGFASVSDDLHMRVWKSNDVAAAWLKDERAAAEWSWGGRSYDQ